MQKIAMEWWLGENLCHVAYLEPNGSYVPPSLPPATYEIRYRQLPVETSGWKSRADSGLEWDGALTDLEARAEIDSLADLQHRRRALITENVGLIARYGAFGMYDDLRKAFVETEKVRAQAVLEKAGARITDKQIDSMAHASQRYTDFLDQAATEKAKWILVNLEITEIEERIFSRGLALTAWSREAGLHR